MGSREANLVISKAEVNEGTTAKKLKPRACGRSYAIKRTTCHITIVVKDISLDEYEKIYSLKNPRWKKTIMIYSDVYTSGVSKEFMSRKQTRFHLFKRSSFPFKTLFLNLISNSNSCWASKSHSSCIRMTYN
ncbi:50S ribosomal protein l22 plastid [Phtheirospermum japonicum]|uniref:50S ribosomal protein l22 plastid n=1 Tax=Phtheirospermum japonicum TaxID=374723 RepID=A0A830CM42_9LAMI|nr:50S ribosomal protein l22 plastid [Phtheirospermum japonicum]